MENNWKDLEIGNIPSDFFVNDRYEIEFKDTDGLWKHNSCSICNRTKLIDLSRVGDKYRYRLKPLEPIRITGEIYDYLISMIRENHAENGKFEYEISNYINTWKIDSIQNRPVEIIDEK